MQTVFIVQTVAFVLRYVEGILLQILTFLWICLIEARMVLYPHWEEKAWALILFPNKI